MHLLKYQIFEQDMIAIHEQRIALELLDKILCNDEQGFEGYRASAPA